NRRKSSSDEDVVFAEMLNDLCYRVLRIHHHEIGMRVNWLQHSAYGLVEEFLPIIPIAFNEILHRNTISQCHTYDLGHDRVKAVLQKESTQSSNSLLR